MLALEARNYQHKLAPDFTWERGGKLLIPRRRVTKLLSLAHDFTGEGGMELLSLAPDITKRGKTLL